MRLKNLRSRNVGSQPLPYVGGEIVAVGEGQVPQPRLLVRDFRLTAPDGRERQIPTTPRTGNHFLQPLLRR